MITAHNMTLSITGIMISVYPAVSDRDMVRTPAGARGVMVKPLAATLAARANSRGFSPISTAMVTATTVISAPTGIFPGPMADRRPVTRKRITGTR